MFEQEQLLDAFDEILRRRRASAEQLTRLLSQVNDEPARRRLAELGDHARRHIALTERLREIVG